MADDPFKDLFGKDSSFEELFGNLFGKSGDKTPNSPDSDPRGNALLITFTREIRRGDKSYLERAVVEYKPEVYEREDNPSLLEAHAKAALFVGKLPLCCESLRKIKNPNPRQKQAIGLVEYNQGNYGSAVKSFLAAKENLSLPARIAYSLSLLEIGQPKMTLHIELLYPALEKKSSVANSIIGCIAFNESNYNVAEEWLEKAARLNPSSEKARLDLMRAMYANGKSQEIYAQMNSFYVDTNSGLSAEEVTKQIRERKLRVPGAPIKNLFVVIDSLLG